ncbi:MAG: hypothetical protein J1E34_01470 [Oscillospiraceae bacterium]|nr:hypothetical protein [Oscillospiraceae bacterium]
MKKNIVRVISLLLVAVMLVACTACTQTILVRFVDKDGNDISFGSALPVGNGSAETPSDNNGGQDTPSDVPSSDNPSEAPSDDNTTTAPSNEGTTAAPSNEGTTAAPSNEGTTAAPSNESTTKAPENTTAAAPTSSAPSTKDEVVAFYSKAVNDIKNNAVAGFDKIEFQTIKNFNITGNGVIDGIIKNIAGQFFTDEASAETKVSAKGSDDAKNRIEEWNLKDNSKVVSATCKDNGGKYTVTIVMADEDTPHKGGNSHLDAVGSVLVWEDIEKELKGISQVKEWENGNVQVLYTKYTITAVMTPDGHFESITHHTDVVIQVNHVKISFLALDNKNVAMENTIRFTNFKY